MSRHSNKKRTDTAARIGRRVDTKSKYVLTFGNDALVDTEPCVAFGNDAIGFIRVRRRKLKAGPPGTWRAAATTSLSFDLVRAVRVNGQPRHKFVLGLGSQKNIERNLDRWWACAIGRMTRHGLTELQQQRLIDEMIRKGARP